MDAGGVADSGIVRRASVRTETAPGPLDQLSRQLARAGQLPAHRRRPHGVHGPGMRAAARMLWSTTSPVTANLALMEALVECLLTVRDMLAAVDRAHAARVMAGHARAALTEVHMRYQGLDPAKRYVRDYGSPVWAARQRARVIVDRVEAAGRTEVENESPMPVTDGMPAGLPAAGSRAAASTNTARSSSSHSTRKSTAQRAAGPLTPPSTGTANRRGAGAGKKPRITRDRLAWMEEDPGFAPEHGPAGEPPAKKQQKKPPRPATDPFGGHVMPQIRPRTIPEGSAAAVWNTERRAAALSPSGRACLLPPGPSGGTRSGHHVADERLQRAAPHGGSQPGQQAGRRTGNDHGCFGGGVV